MKQSDAQYNASLKYRRKKSAQIVITMRKDDKTEWDEYAKSKGKPTATMIREAVAASMEASNGQPAEAPAETPKPQPIEQPKPESKPAPVTIPLATPVPKPIKRSDVFTLADKGIFLRFEDIRKMAAYPDEDFRLIIEAIAHFVETGEEYPMGGMVALAYATMAPKARIDISMIPEPPQEETPPAETESGKKDSKQETEPQEEAKQE